jgi:hypothetical protein
MGRTLIGTRPEVRVLPGPPPTLTSRNAGCLVRRPSGRGVFEIRPLTWLPLLVMGQVQHCPPLGVWVLVSAGLLWMGLYLRSGTLDRI